MSDSGVPPLSLVRRAMKWCRCCPDCLPEGTPCTGAMVTGICDDRPCRCDDDNDDGYGEGDT